MADQSNNYLYLYENTVARPEVYIGIGHLTRPYEAHNPDAEALRDASDTNVVITPEPFSTRADAERAEALMIHVAAMFGGAASGDLEEEPDQVVDKARAQVTNRAGTKGTRHLAPAIFKKDGEVDYFDLERTALVTLRPAAIDERNSLHGGRSAATFADRAREFWGLQRACVNGYNPVRLLAVLTGDSTIVGDWDLVEDDPIIIHGGGNDTFRVVDANADDPRGVKGMKLNHFRGSQTVSWSQDIANEHGLKGQVIQDKVMAADEHDTE